MSTTRDDIESAITRAFHDNGDMVTKWALVAECIDDDGQRGFWMLSPDGQKAWDSLGLIEYARQIELSGTLIQGLRENS